MVVNVYRLPFESEQRQRIPSALADLVYLVSFVVSMCLLSIG